MRSVIGLLLFWLASAQHWLRRSTSKHPNRPHLLSKCDLGSRTRIVLLDAGDADLAEIQTASRITVPAILTGNREKRHCLVFARRRIRRQ
jgi:hypothetical protein